MNKRSTFRCPTCSGTWLPPSWIQVKTEWDALSARDRDGLLPILSALRHGQPDVVRDWMSAIGGVVDAFLPSFWEAWDVTGDGVCRFLDPDPDEPEEAS